MDKVQFIRNYYLVYLKDNNLIFRNFEFKTKTESLFKK